MQVTNRIDQLILELTKLKPALSDVSSSNEKRFNDLLAASIETSYTVPDEAIKAEPSPNAKLENQIPSWVNLDYGYDPQNPRKPNMRELMEAMSGKDVKDLYATPDENLKKISRQASNILYGVVGGNDDTRDWLSIMESENILSAAREQTRVMYEPKVDIHSNFNDNGILTKQIAVIKDNNGNILSSLPSDLAYTEQKLLDFGATKASIPTNIEERIEPEKFDADLLAFLKNYDNGPPSIEQIVVESASEVITNKLSQEIPLDELAKL